MHGMTRYFHTTDAADAILRDGLRDSEGSYGFPITLRGVWIADTPLDMNEGAVGDEVLEVILPSEINVADWELVKEGTPTYREWCAVSGPS